MKMMRNEEGQMLVLTALSMTVMFGFMAIAVDVGLLFRAKRNLQIAADAAATSAALDYYYNNGTLGASAIDHAVAEGKTASQSNGFQDGANGVSVSISCAPTSGPEASASCNGFFEAKVTKSQSNFFLAAFSGMPGQSASLKTISVGARGVAGTPSASNNCIWLMDPTASGQLTLQGSATLNAPGCGIYLNSTSPSEVSLTGQPRITVQALNLHGPQDVTKGVKKMVGDLNNNVVPQSPPIPTDFAGAKPGDCNVTNPTISATGYTPPGAGSPSTTPIVVCFTNLVTLSGGSQASPIVMGGQAPFGSGQTSTSAGVIYEFEAGLTIGTGAWVKFGNGTYTAPTGSNPVGTYSNTSGATIDMEGGAFNILSGQANLSVYAPTSGSYNGIAIMQPSSNKSNSSTDCSGQTKGCMSTQFGSANTNFDGMIFVPGGEVVMHDQGGGVTASGLIAAGVNMATSTLTINNYSAANPYTTPLRSVTLTE
jgi:Flp pilus assembly protein TadG